MVNLAGYVVCVLIPPKGVLWDLDRSSEKASPVFEHPFCQTIPAQVSMCEWSSYPSGREMGLPRKIVIELGEQHCPECPHTSQSSYFQPTRAKGPRANHDNHPYAM